MDPNRKEERPLCLWVLRMRYDRRNMHLTDFEDMKEAVIDANFHYAAKEMKAKGGKEDKQLWVYGRG